MSGKIDDLRVLSGGFSIRWRKSYSLPGLLSAGVIRRRLLGLPHFKVCLPVYIFPECISFLIRHSVYANFGLGLLVAVQFIKGLRHE